LAERWCRSTGRSGDDDRVDGDRLLGHGRLGDDRFFDGYGIDSRRVAGARVGRRYIHMFFWWDAVGRRHAEVVDHSVRVLTPGNERVKVRQHCVATIE
jgi:hypothetical protein